MLFLLLGCLLPAAQDGGAPSLALAGCTGTMEFDAKVDGSIDGTWVFIYNRSGDPVSATWDSDNSHSQMQYRYEGPLLVERTWDANLDGNMDMLTSYRYSEDGLLLESLEDQGLDGSIEARSLWSYPAAGFEKRASVQKNIRGSVLKEEGYFFWDGPLKTGIQWHPGDNSGDSLVSYLYNEQGLVIQEEIDWKMDGVVEQRESIVRDELGRELIKDKDTNADGIADYRSSWSYNCSG
jgi:hypothetical protein